MAQMQAAYPVDLQVDYPEKSSRGLALLGILFFLKALLLLPHFIITYFVAIIAFILVFIAYVAVLFTGKYPRGMFDFVAGYLRWNARMTAWLFGLTDKYPPFAMK